MAYEISLRENPHCVILKYSDTINREIALEANIFAHRLAKEAGVRNYLVDLRETKNRESVSENYQFAYHDMRMTKEVDRGAKIILVVSPDDHSHDFIETLTRNAGFDVTLFRDYEEALQHLSEN